MSYKLVCFDVDGTLIQELKEKMLAHTGYIEPHEFEDSIWVTLHRYFKTTNEAREQYKEFHDGILSYKNWVEKNVALWEKRGADRKKIEKAFAEFTVQTTGAEETIRELHERGLKIILVSGSMNTIVDTLFLERLFDDSFINKARFDAKGKLVSWTVTTLFDTHGRHKTIKDVCKKEGISPAQTVFVGNGENDILIFGEVGLGIAFCPKSVKVEEVADIVVKKKDLREILKYF